MDRIDIVCTWCEQDYIFVKAYRKAMGFSQRKMADRTLTSQCYISQLERRTITKVGEQDRIVFNTRCDLREVCDSVNTFTETMILINVLVEYLKLSKNSYPIQAKKITRLIVRFSKELGSDI